MKKKPNRIRRIFKVFAAVILILLVLMVLLPFLFKGQIMEAAKKEINSNLEARVGFEDFGLNLFSHFPNFSFHLDHVSVSGINDFEGDTLATIESVSVVLDLFNVVKGDTYEIKSIHIARPDVYLKVAENGKYNWDIAPREETDDAGQRQSDEEGSNFRLALKKFEIRDAHIVYEDVPGNMIVTLSGTDHFLSGDLTADNTSLQTRTNIAEFLIEQNGITYLNRAIVAFDASIDADLKNEIYTFRKNALRINELLLQFDGSVAMDEGDPNIILTFDAPKNTFRNFLSLVPAIYQEDFKDIETEGDLSFSGYVKGIYTGSELPSFKLEVLVDRASFKYPELPSSVSAIQLDMDIDHPGGDMDKLTVDVRKFRFSMLDNPFDMTLFVSTPVSDPYFSTRVNGRVDLSSVSKVYPLGQDETISGSIDAAITLKGRLSNIEKKAYKDVDASGSVLVKDFIYSTGDVDETYEIKHAQLNFAPAYLDLVNLDFLYGSSDINIKGKIENYLAYALCDQGLKGELNARSKYFNTNQFISGDNGSGEIQDASDTDTASLSAFKVPANLDVKINAGFNRVIYDNMELSDATGIISIKDEKLTISNLKGNVLGGTIGVNGFYDSRNIEQPLVDLEVNISRISFQKAFATFGILQKFAPVFEHAAGDFSTTLSMNTRLKQDMNPDWVTFVGNGLMNTSEISLENVNTLDKLADVLKIPSLKELDINPLKILFDIREGKLFLKPTDITMEGIQAGLSGWTSIDETMEYTLNMQIPRGIFGEEANAVVDGLLNQAKAGGANISIGNTVNLDVLIGGTLSNPTVKPSIGSSGKGIMEDISTTVQQEIDKKKEELEQAARAEAQKILNEAEQQALKVISEAQKQAEQVRKTGREAAQVIRTNADAHAKALVEEGKKKGILAETAAKKTAEEYKKKAYSEADQMVAEADKKADGIINTAKQQAARIRSDAQKKVDAL